MSDNKVEGIIKVPDEVVLAATSNPESEEAKVIRELYEKTKDFLGSVDVNIGNTLSLENCPCGSPARYTSPDGGSCNKYQRCKSYEELLEENKLNEKCRWAYRNFVNEIDDYFEYRNESVKDRKKVHQLLQNLTDKLVEIERSK